MAALSYDPVAVLRDFSGRRKIPFPLLSDPDSAIIRRFGLLSPDYPEGQQGHGVPHPTTLVIDPDGTLRGKHSEAAYIQRRTAASVLLLEGLGPDAPADESRAEHFVVRAGVSDPLAAPGNRLTLVLDFEMRDGHHAYAPGEHRYRPLSLRLDPTPLITVHPPVRPESRPFHFAPLDETVPVYAGRFRILQDVTLAGGRELAGVLGSPDPHLLVTGTLEYQVCTERVCHPPGTLPLSFRIGLRPLDLERPPEAARPRGGS